MPGLSRRQPQRLPPPLLDGPGALEAACILEEHPGEMGILLWKTVRALRLWAGLPTVERAHVFGATAHSTRHALILRVAPEDLVEPLLSAAEVLRTGAGDAAKLATACRQVVEWADGRGALGTAVEFAQTAALTDPSDADHAQAAARLMRRGAEYARAEMWYRTAIGAARRTRNWRVFSLSHLGLGVVFVHRGNYPAAERAFLRGFRSARRHSLADLRAMALHELTVLAVRTRRVRQTVKFARAALEAYGENHPRLPALAHDVAVLWMDRGYFGEALRVFTAIPVRFGEPNDQLARASSIVRAAAATGDREAYEQSWTTAESLLSSAGAEQDAAGALIEMARGAEFMRDWSRAEAAVRRALRLARDRGEAERLMEGEAVLEGVERARHLAEKVGSPGRRVPSPVHSLTVQLAGALAAASADER